MKGFTPMLVWYDEESHIKAEALAEAKRRLLDEGSISVSYTHLTLPTNREV